MKRYCRTCADQAFRECRRCHRPMGAKFFRKDPDKVRCDACYYKLIKERQKRAEKRAMRQRDPDYHHENDLDDDFNTPSGVTDSQILQRNDTAISQKKKKKKKLFLEVFALDDNSQIAKQKLLIPLPSEILMQSHEYESPLKEMNSPTKTPSAHDFRGSSKDTHKQSEMESDLEVVASSRASSEHELSESEE